MAVRLVAIDVNIYQASEFSGKLGVHSKYEDPFFHVL